MVKEDTVEMQGMIERIMRNAVIRAILDNDVSITAHAKSRLPRRRSAPVRLLPRLSWLHAPDESMRSKIVLDAQPI